MKHNFIIREVDRRVFEAIKNGEKKIETRKANPKYLAIQKGDIAVFKCGQDILEKEILETRHFKSIDEMLEVYSFKQIMPFVNSKEEMIEVYYSFPGYKEAIEENGLVAMELGE
ncbi:MAG: ASCH domain-containing protein [Candidatus Paceibacterota bacterium]